MRMICMNLHQATAMTGGTLIGKAIQFRGISTDSRKDCSGNLFIALKGDNFNAENYCLQAIENGAVAVLVTKSQEVNIPQLICQDSLEALTILAKNWAKQCSITLIAITGSNGKTTVKNMLKSILSESNQCTATHGNLNNEIGVPLTLCSIHPQDKYVIIEMGAAKVGDISYLINLVEIDVAILTNASAAHIGQFVTMANIINEKGQIVANLQADKHAILPIDDEHFLNWKSNTNAHVLSFGFSDNADIKIVDEDCFNLIGSGKIIKGIKLPIAGKHNQVNAASATAAALALDIDINDIRNGLENFKPESGRLENLGKIDGNTIINDSYNANPQSVRAAIDVLSEYDYPTTLILGDMAELGKGSQLQHKKVGEYAKKQGITHLLTIGKDSKQANLAFSEDNMHFTSINTLKNYLVKNWKQFGTILIKGSRSMHLDHLVDSLIKLEQAA